MTESTQKQSLAVLPFTNMSDEKETDFFCDGITEEIINALSKIEGLKVISRTSSFYFKDHKATLEEISKKLNVSSILEGSVRIAGDTIRIRTQLIDVVDDTLYWSESWDRKMSDLFEIQDEVSLLIADKLREHVGHLNISDQLVESATRNLDAYQLLLEGRFHFNRWNPEDANIAIEKLEKAISIDPKLIDAYLGLADSYSFMAIAGFAPREESWMKAMEAIQAAKAMDENNAGLNYMLGNQAFFTEADFAKSLSFGMKSLSSKPTYSEAHQFMSFLHGLRGDFKKSKEHILFAKSIDPLNSETRFFEANYYYRTQEYDKSIDILDELLATNDKNVPAVVVKIYILIKKQKLKEALSVIESIPLEAFNPDERLSLLSLIAVLNGDANSSDLKELKEHGKEPTAHHAHSYLFIIHSVLGQNDEAFAILEHLFNSKSSILLLGFSDPLAQSIQSDPRYQDYHSKIYPEVSEQPKAKIKPNRTEDHTARLQEGKLKSYVESERPYLNPSLSLRSLAEQVNIHPNQLSWLLNEFVGKNFNEFINHERVEHFKKLVLDPDNSHISLVGLAYESGFNSKTVFNTTFKKIMGITPKEYQKSHS